jgi:hypothetical protein
MSHPTPPRVAERPDPRDWDDYELLTLPEAAGLFWPRGPLTVATLRTAIRDGRLGVTVIARKFFVTPASIREMSRPGGRAAIVASAPEPGAGKDCDLNPWRDSKDCDLNPWSDSGL